MMRKSSGAFLCAGIILALSWIASPSTLTVNEAIELALSNHPDIRQEELKVQLAELQLQAVLATIGIPALDLQISAPTLSNDGFSSKVSGQFGAGFSLPWGTSSQVVGALQWAWDRLTGKWTVPGWGMSFVQTVDFADPETASDHIDQKRDAVERAREKLAKARAVVVMETINRYSQLLSDGQSLDNAEADFIDAKENLATVEELAERGLRGEQSLLEARLQVLDARIEVDELRSSHEEQLARFSRQWVGAKQLVVLIPMRLNRQALVKATADFLSDESVISTAIDISAEVDAAKQGAHEAEQALQAAQRAALPSLSISAGITEQGWTVGCNLHLDLFSPNRGLQLEIAKVQLSLALQTVSAARIQRENYLTDQFHALDNALRSLNRLPLEEEKLALEVDINQTRFEAGSISAAEWQAQLKAQNAFLITAEKRVASLLLALLEFRDALGLDLHWEEWLP